jgi:hypothetical protein
VHVLRRCSSLQALEVDALPSLKLSFHGWGQTPAEQRSSMRQQAEALNSSGVVLAMPSWPTCRCLTALTLDVSTTEEQHAPILSSALQTPSPGRPPGDLQQHPGCRRLCKPAKAAVQTQQPCVPQRAAAPRRPAARSRSRRPGAPSHRRLGHQPNLQQLAFLWSGNPDEDICCVPSLSQLSRLTQLELHLGGLQVDPHSLSGFTALQHSRPARGSAA